MTPNFQNLICLKRLKTAYAIDLSLTTSLQVPSIKIIHVNNEIRAPRNFFPKVRHVIGTTSESLSQWTRFC